MEVIQIVETKIPNDPVILGTDGKAISSKAYLVTYLVSNEEYEELVKEIKIESEETNEDDLPSDTVQCEGSIQGDNKVVEMVPRNKDGSGSDGEGV